MTGIGICIPCMADDHENCNGARSTGCTCADHNHPPTNASATS